MDRGRVSAYCQATMRAERGQTAAEYMGVLLLVGVIVVVVLSAGTGTAVAGGIRYAICSIMQKDDCDAPATPRAPGVGDSDLDGPSLTDHPLIALPFPGSVTVSCTYDERDPETCVPHGGPGVSVQAGGELKIERTPTSLDANGCPWQNLSLQTKLQLSANAEAKGAKAGGSLSGYLGQSTTFQVTVRARPGRRDRRRRPPAAEPRRPDHAQGRRERPALRGLLRGRQRQGLLPRAPTRAGLRRGPPRVQRRQARQPDDACG